MLRHYHFGSNPAGERQRDQSREPDHRELSNRATGRQLAGDNDTPGEEAESPYAAAAPVYNIHYGGTTVLLTAQAFISANVTNHVKIAIADYSDDALDSAIFLKAQSSTCP